MRHADGTLKPAESDPALARLWDALPDARLVGGAVRDLLAGLPVADFDLATARAPADVMRVLGEAGIRTVPTGLAHGTVTAVIEGRPFEITTLRRDLRTDGRRAETAWTDDWQEDAARRDFTINAMSLDRAGGLHDHFGGREDLAAGRVRFVGDARRRIDEDHLRILRFFRFFARYGAGAPDPDATGAIGEKAGLVARLSPERVWSETRRLLAGPRAAATAALMAELGVLAVLLPDGADPARLGRLLEAGAPPDPVLRLSALAAEGAPEPLARRFRMSGVEAKMLASLRAAPAISPAADDDTVLRLLADHPAPVLQGASFLAQAGGAAGEGADTAAWDALRARLDRLPRPVFPLAGRDILRAGIPAGPEVGAALASLRAAWLESGTRLTRAELLARLPRRGA